MKLASILTVIFFILFEHTNGQTIYYVKENGTGSGNSWENASGNLKHILDNAVPNSQVWVANGTYRPTMDNDRSSSFVVKTSVKLYGGFSGDEVALSARDWSTNKTILSGDIDENDVLITPSPLKGNLYKNNEGNSFNVLILEGSSVVDGFTVTGGNANGTHFNYQVDGGGINSSPSVWGSPSRITINNCRILNNSASGNGGGINTTSFYSTTSYSNMALNNCFISNNSAGVDGGGIYASNNFYSTHTELNNCVVSNNSAAKDGGGIYASADSIYSAAGIVLNNSTLVYNAAGENGGAICCYSKPGSVPPTRGTNTIIDIKNCVLSYNIAGEGKNYYHHGTAKGLTTIKSSYLQGEDLSGSNNNLNGINISEPYFTDILTGDYRLANNSPLINKGDNTLLPIDTYDINNNNNTSESWPFDLDGLPRINSVIDLGAYEYQGPVQTLQATHITTTSATLNGTVTAGDKSAVITIQYSLSADMSNSIIATLSIGTSPILPGSGTQNYSSDLTDLIPGTKYYYKISSKDDLSTISGVVQQFITIPLPPTITSFSPISAPAGTKITITGTNLEQLTGVSFGGTKSITYQEHTVTSAFANVPLTGSSGDLKIITRGGTASLSGFIFIPIPTITAGGPIVFKAGDNVVLSTENNPGYTYQWKKDGIDINGANTYNYMATQAGVYTVSVSISGYMLTSATLEVSVSPLITDFIPKTSTQGRTITITGSNFSNTSSVSFGGTSATDFSVISPTIITAVLGKGASGNIVVTNAAGTATIPGFNFVPIPTISASGPTKFVIGESVTLFAYPSSGYSYQWKKDGIDIVGAKDSAYIATLEGDYSVTITLNSVSQTSAISKISTSSLPINNFSLEASSATCKNANNGSISISAIQHLNYTALFEKDGISNYYNFIDHLKVENLASGTYSICLSLTNQPADKQCFTLKITEPKDLEVYTSIVKNKKITLTLGGAQTYYITHNNSSYKANNAEITLKLEQGNNKITITTDQLCQGKFEKDIMLVDDYIVYPNPFEDKISLNLGEKNIPLLSLNIFTTDGKLVFESSYTNVQDIVQFDLSFLEKGLYILRLSDNKSDKIYKILKR